MSAEKNLESLVKRLETATVRLEALSNQKPSLAPKPGASSSTLSVMNQEAPPTIRQYEDLVEEPLRNFKELSSKIGDSVDEIASKVSFIFNLQRDFIWHAAGQKEPNAQGLKEKVSHIVKQLEEIAAYKESKRNTPFFNHLSAVAEGIQAVGWITVKPTPAPFVKEMFDASMFYVNRVRTEFKSNAVHSDWAKAWCEIFTGLQKYVRQEHTTGLVWNSVPGTAPPNDVSTGAAATAKTKAGGPPPPPPPPPADLLADVKKSTGGASQSSSDDRQALFAELNKGEKITAGLKKVTADMQTHKNASLRAQSTVPAKAAKTAAGASTGAKPLPDKPPKLELQDGKTWNVEYQKGNRDIVIEIKDMKQCVYVFRCENSVVQIKGKVNSVTLDGCKKTSVVFDNLLSQVEVINSQSVEVQTLGSLPTISIQKTDGCQVYLSKDALNAEIVTSKSSEMNVLVPKGDGDFSEFPVPEQFKTTFNQSKKKLETTVSDIV
jgi:adenylyl cyclase-associated protein